MKFLSATVLLFVVLISGCDKNGQIAAGRYGMMSEDTPQYTAVLFMNAIYNENNLDQAVELSTDRFGKVLAAYYSARTVQRQVFNLRLDEATLEPVSGGALLYSELQDDASIEMKIIGHFGNDKVTELRTLSMVKVRGQWRVADVTNTVP